jgi:hypothetical protein
MQCAMSHGRFVTVQKTFEDVTTDKNDGVWDNIPKRVNYYKLNPRNNVFSLAASSIVSRFLSIPNCFVSCINQKYVMVENKFCDSYYMGRASSCDAQMSKNRTHQPT